jgi:HSP20 family protein
MTNVKLNTRSLESSLNNLVDSFFSELPVLFKNEFNSTASKGFAPVNVKETDNAFQMEIVAPGFEKTDFNVSLDNNLLTVSAEKKEEAKEEKEKEIRREYNYRSFKRTFTLDEKVDASNIGASYINGVLILNLPKKEEVKPATKEIKVS